MLNSLPHLRSPCLALGSGSVVWNISTSSCGHVLLVLGWQWICSDCLLVFRQLRWRCVGSVPQPVMPTRLHTRDVNTPVSVLNPSRSQVDFLWHISLVVLVSPVILAHQPTSLGIVVVLDLPGCSSEARRIDVLDGTNNRGGHCWFERGLKARKS